MTVAELSVNSATHVHICVINTSLHPAETECFESLYVSYLLQNVKMLQEVFAVFVETNL